MAENQFIDEKQSNELDPKIQQEIIDVRRVIDNTLLEFHNYEFPKHIGNYKKYLGFVGDRLKTIDAKWMSNVDYPLVASIVDTMFGNIFDFGYEFGINDAMMKKICNDAFDFRSTGREALKECGKEVLICGKAYTRDYLLKERSSRKLLGKEIKQTIKYPSMHYISIFDVMYDRTKGLKKSPYKIIRTFMTGEAIKSKLLPLFIEASKDDEKTVEKKFDALLLKYKDTFNSRFGLYNYNPVKSLALTTQFFNANPGMDYALPYCKDSKELNAYRSGDENEKRNNYFLHSDESTYEVVEYFTNNRRFFFLNGTIAWFGNRKQGVGEIYECQFSNIPGTGNANGVADNIGGLQEINNSIWNAFLDNIKLVLGPMFKVTWNLPIGKDGTLDFARFRAFRSNGNTDIEKIQLGVTDFAPINFMQTVEAFSQNRSWVNNYVMGSGGGIERVAWGIEMRFNQYKSKLTPVTDSIDQMMGNIARSWLLMYFTFFTREELLKMGVETEDKFDDKGKFETILVNGIDIMEIIDERNVKFTFNSLSKLTKENSRTTITQNLGAILQYAGQQVNLDEIVKIMLGLDFDPNNVVKKVDPNAPKPQQYGAPQMGAPQYGQQQSYWQQQGQYQQGWQYQQDQYGQEQAPEEVPPDQMDEQQILDQISQVTG